MSRQLDGKVAVVTGAGRGIGKAIAEAYGEAGASVCCLARTLPEIQSTAAEIQGKGSRAFAVAADVRDPDAVARAFEQAARAFGGIDILVINAGVNTAHGSVEDGDPLRWRETLETNLLGAYYCARTAIPYLRRRGAGKIITIGSGLGHRGTPGRSAYSSSKAGLWMLTRALAQELAQYRISVNELVPGPVRTSIDAGAAASTGQPPFAETEWLKLPADVVPLALFLAAQPDFGPTAQSYSLMRRDG
ncbi:MAG: SDR family NAD(P)-dependent oxidoreductase [Armatimonadota bacterium]